MGQNTRPKALVRLGLLLLSRKFRGGGQAITGAGSEKIESGDGAALAT